MIPTVPLGDLCRPKQWKVLSKSQMAVAGYPVYGANGKIGHADSYTHEHPTILIGCRGSCGTVHVSEPKSYANGNAMALDDLDGSRAVLSFLVHFCRARGFADVITGTSQPQIIRQNLVKVQVPLPPLKEQRRIAAILDQADALRAKRREGLARLDDLTQSIFLDMFGEGETTLAKLGDHLTFVTSGGRGWAKYYTEQGSRFIRSLDVRMNSIRDTDSIYVEPPDNAEARRTAVREGDVLLTITGSRIGRVSAVPARLGGAFVSQHVAILRAGRQTLRAEYLAFVLSLPLVGQRQIASFQYGQTKPGLNFEQIRGFSVPVPDIAAQDEFLRRLRAAKEYKTRGELQESRMHDLFASLQSAAFAGQL